MVPFEQVRSRAELAAQAAYLEPVVERLLHDRDIPIEMATFLSRAISTPEGTFQEKAAFSERLRIGQSSTRHLYHKAAYGYTFDLRDLFRDERLKDRRFIDAVMQWTPNLKRESVVGRGEMLMVIAFEGARLTHKGDVYIPDLGNVEIKTVGGKDSYFVMNDGFESTEARRQTKLALETYNIHAKSLARKTINQVISNFGVPTYILDDLARTLTNNRVRLNYRPDIDIDWSNPRDQDSFFFGPIAADSFGQMKKNRNFDTMLIVNRDSLRARFVNNEKQFLESVRTHNLKLVPSGLSFTNIRGTSIGVNLP